MRLTETAHAAAGRGLERFSTSLSVSPLWHHDLIVRAGLAAAEVAGVESVVYADLLGAGIRAASTKAGDSGCTGSVPAVA